MIFNFIYDRATFFIFPLNKNLLLTRRECVSAREMKKERNRIKKKEIKIKTSSEGVARERERLKKKGKKRANRRSRHYNILITILNSSLVPS